MFFLLENDDKIQKRGIICQHFYTKTGITNNHHNSIIKFKLKANNNINTGRIKNLVHVVKKDFIKI